MLGMSMPFDVDTARAMVQQLYKSAIKDIQPYVWNGSASAFYNEINPSGPSNTTQKNVYIGLAYVGLNNIAVGTDQYVYFRRLDSSGATHNTIVRLFQNGGGTAGVFWATLPVCFSVFNYSGADLTMSFVGFRISLAR